MAKTLRELLNKYIPDDNEAAILNSGVVSRSLVDKENIIVNIVYYDEKDINKYNEILTGMGYKNINFLTYNDITI